MRKLDCVVVLLLAMTVTAAPSFAADAAFTQFVASLWPQARDAGVSRATFERETRGLEPDYRLPDLVLPGRAPSAAPSQAEFVQVPADYLKEASIARLAAHGRTLLQRHRGTLEAIERRFGVPGAIILAIWGRETDYGRHALPYDGLRVLATQAYVGRRKEQYRGEFHRGAEADRRGGDVSRAQLRTSWGGATGLTQFLPSELDKHGVDFDGDGRVDIWNSVPDALASAAQQLKNKGWRPGVRWAYEVRTPRGVDCTLGVPEVTRPIAQWLRDGFVPVRGERIAAAAQAEPHRSCNPRARTGRRSSPRRTTSSSRNTTSPTSTCCSSAISPTGSTAVRPLPRHGRPRRSCAAPMSKRCSATSRGLASMGRSSTARPACRPAPRSAPTRSAPGS